MAILDKSLELTVQRSSGAVAFDHVYLCGYDDTALQLSSKV